MLQKKIKNYFIFLKNKKQKKNLYNLNNIHNYNIKLKAIVMSTINKKQKKTTISQTEWKTQIIFKKIFLTRWELYKLIFSNYNYNLKKWLK